MRLMDERSGRIAVGILLIFVAAYGLLVVTGGAAATAAVVDGNETVTVDSESETVYAEVTANASVNATGVTVEFYGIDDGGNETLENTTVIPTLVNNTTELVEEPVNSSAYGEYRVVVSSDAGNVATVDVGVFQQVVGGVGGVLGDASTEEYALVAVAVIGLLWFLTEG